MFRSDKELLRQHKKDKDGLSVVASRLRKEREGARKKQKCIVLIQSVVRGVLSRKKTRGEICTRCKSKILDIQRLQEMLQGNSFRLPVNVFIPVRRFVLYSSQVHVALEGIFICTRF